MNRCVEWREFEGLCKEVAEAAQVRSEKQDRREEVKYAPSKGDDVDSGARERGERVSMCRGKLDGNQWRQMQAAGESAMRWQQSQR